MPPDAPQLLLEPHRRGRQRALRPAGDRLKTLTVSRATLRFLRQGHPWVRPDKHTHGLERLRAGDAVRLVDERGVAVACALADPQAAVCARVYAFSPDRPFDPAAAFSRAWERRAALHADPATDCYRLVHGEGDALPGLRVERYGDAVVVLVQAACARSAAEVVAAEVARRLPRAAIIVREHLADLRRAEPRARRFPDGAPPDADAAFTVSELGVRLRARPFAGLATGVYVDQRATRTWLRADCAGARVLNLFAYTGAFSMSLLAAGAAAAIDVDLSAPALRWAREHAELNGVADRHRAEHADCQAWVATAAARGDAFDIIIVDPPTAAQGGEGWVLARDYPRLLAATARLLAPGGRLVACRNTLSGRFDLARAVRDAAGAAAITVERIAPPPLGIDLPQLDGFPEGRPFELCCVRRMGSPPA